MERESRGIGKGLYYLFGLLAVLQVAAIVGLIYFAGESLKRDRTLLDRSTAMMEEIFPAMKSDLSQISNKASEIRDDLSGLRVQVSNVDESSRDIAQGVTNLNRQIDGLDKGLSGFFKDKNGIVWGNALNPYVLIALLVVIALSIPVCFRAFNRRNPPPCREQRDPLADPCAGLTDALDRLSGVVDKALAADVNSRLHGVELRKLIADTEKLIQEARTELVWIAHTTPRGEKQAENSPERLN